MNLDTIKIDTESLVDDSIDQNKFIGWANSIHRIIKTSFPWIFAMSSATYTADGTKTYVLVSTFSVSNLSKIIKLRDNTNNIDYKPRLYEEKDQMTADANYEYTVSPDNSTIYLGVDTAGNTLELFYRSYDDEYTKLDDEPSFNPDFHDIYIYGVGWLFLKSDQNPNAPDNERLFLNRLDQMKEFYNRHTEDEPLRIRNITEGYNQDFNV